MQFPNQFGNVGKVPQAQANEVSTKQGCLDFTILRARLNDTDEGMSKIVFDGTDKNCWLAEARKLIGLMLIFMFVRNPDIGRSHVRAMEITTLRRRSRDFSCSYAGIQAIALQKAAV